MGNTLQLNCSGNGKPAPSYQWKHFQKIVGNNSLLVLKNMNDTYIATYECHVKNSAGEYIVKIDANEQCKHSILFYRSVFLLFFY